MASKYEDDLEEHPPKIAKTADDLSESLSNLLLIRDELKSSLKWTQNELIEIVEETEKANEMSQKLLTRYLKSLSSSPGTLQPLVECLEETKRTRKEFFPAMRHHMEILSNSNDCLKNFLGILQESLLQNSEGVVMNVEGSQHGAPETNFRERITRLEYIQGAVPDSAVPLHSSEFKEQFSDVESDIHACSESIGKARAMVLEFDKQFESFNLIEE